MTREELEMRTLVRESDVIDRTDGSELAKAFNCLWEKYVEQEPCEDAISREDALMCLTGEIEETDTIETIIARFVRRIRKLPPVNPQPKIGRWIYGEDNSGTGRDGWYCNQCGHFEFWDYSSDMKSAKLNLPNPCPNCGFRMIEPQGSEG